MHGIKGAVIIAALVATVAAVSACRKDVRHDPLKGLGASDVTVTEQAVQ